MNDRVDVGEPDVSGRPFVTSDRRRDLRARMDALAQERAPSSLAKAIAALKQEAQGNGLTDEIVDAELVAWRAERND